MTHQRIEQVFPSEVAKHGTEVVWAAWMWVCEHAVVEGQTTMGEAKRLTRERLQCQAEGSEPAYQ